MPLRFLCSDQERVAWMYTVKHKCFEENTVVLRTESLTLIAINIHHTLWTFSNYFCLTIM